MTAHSFPFCLLVRAAFGLAPVPELSFVLQAAAAGAALGSAVALWARRRDPDVDTWRITTAWATLGLAVGTAVALLSAL